MSGNIQGFGRKIGNMFGLRSRAQMMSMETPFQAGESSLSKGNLQFDPRISQIRDEGLGNLRGMLDESRGNQSAFIKARVNPLQARISKQRGALDRSLQRRGIFGSIGNQEITNFGLDSERALGDARALATNESMAQRKAINDAILGVGTTIQQGDLAGLGLGVQSMLGLGAQNLGAAGLQDAAGQRALDTLMKIIACSHEFKENKKDIDYDETLEKLDSIPIQKWNYKGEKDVHISPYAEDFNEAFDLDGGQFIFHIDMFGVMMASIKALSSKVKELEAR